jgi:hypothetical protein
MGDSFLAVAVFLAGAISGALLKYLQDRRLLRLYAQLVEDLTRTQQPQVEAFPQAQPKVSPKVVAFKGKARAGSLS